MFTLLQLILAGCSERIETPLKGEDSTIVYQSKSKGGIEAKITFCEKVSKKTGDPIKAGTVFSIKENKKVNSIIYLNNRERYKDKVLMFHVDWLDSSGNSLYKKRIDLPANDSSSTITSSISISPQKRKTGNYIVRVYLFRELFAEKKFQLVDSATYSKLFPPKEKPKKEKQQQKKITKKKVTKIKTSTGQVKADLILCKNLSKKTGKPIGVDSIFVIGDKVNIKAVLNIEKSEVKADEQMKFYFEWIGPDNKTFYKKKVEYSTGDSTFTISNSISISPEKRQAGSYTLKILYRKKIIAEKKFELILPEQKLKPDSVRVLK